MTPHTLNVTEILRARGVELAHFTARITVNIIPPSGDGWNEPREPRTAELAGVVQLDGPHIPPAELSEWADVWVYANQRQIFDSYSLERAF